MLGDWEGFENGGIRNDTKCIEMNREESPCSDDAEGFTFSLKLLVLALPSCVGGSRGVLIGVENGQTTVSLVSFASSLSLSNSFSLIRHSSSNLHCRFHDSHLLSYVITSEPDRMQFSMVLSEITPMYINT